VPIAGNEWRAEALEYLRVVGTSEYTIQQDDWIKKKRKLENFRYKPSDYYSKLHAYLKKGMELEFKALKAFEGWLRKDLKFYGKD
jgi:hypothetical protein